MIDREALLKSRLPEREVDIPGVGSVRVRGLSRSEVIRMGQLGQADLDAAENFLVARGLVEPALSDDDVAAWRAAAPGGELDPVVDTIVALSGLGEDALNEAARSFRGGPSDEPGVLRGPGAGDDGGPAT